MTAVDNLSPAQFQNLPTRYPHAPSFAHTVLTSIQDDGRWATTGVCHYCKKRVVNYHGAEQECATRRATGEARR